MVSHAPELVYALVCGTGGGFTQHIGSVVRPCAGLPLCIAAAGQIWA